MLPIIKAEEAQGLMQCVQFGTGNMDEKTARIFAKDINKQASIRNEHNSEIPPEIKKAIMSSLGVAVIDMKDKSLPNKYKKKLFPFNPGKTKD
jgi:hypothetical protein